LIREKTGAPGQYHRCRSVGCCSGLASLRSGEPSARRVLRVSSPCA